MINEFSVTYRSLVCDKCKAEGPSAIVLDRGKPLSLQQWVAAADGDATYHPSALGDWACYGCRDGGRK